VVFISVYNNIAMRRAVVKLVYYCNVYLIYRRKRCGGV